LAYRNVPWIERSLPSGNAERTKNSIASPLKVPFLQEALRKKRALTREKGKNLMDEKFP
jgi:hypothetical protein